MLDTRIIPAMHHLRILLEEARCPADQDDHDHHGTSHCAECCFGTGWLADGPEDLAFLMAADSLLKQYEEMGGLRAVLGERELL